ncbi:MAG: DnaD domain protein [Clostridiales bacterium]|nr:DnaD domain protein [Clostridiales bacterium]
MYKLNPSAYDSVFVLPDAVVDKYIHLASELQLKALLLIAKNGIEDKSAKGLSLLLKKNEDDVKDALEFWVSEGILISDEEYILPVKNDRNDEKPKEEKKEIESIPIVKPTMEHVIARDNEDAEIHYLFIQAQEMLGRTIGWDGQSRLLMVHDYYGLPVDVILTMLSYLKGIGKTSSAEITKLAKSWAEDEITTHEAANEYIDKMNAAQGLYDEMKKRFGIKHERPSAKQAAYLSDWLEAGFSQELIFRAYDEMVDRTDKPSLAYVNKILLGWKEQGLRTADEVEKAEKNKQSKKRKQNKEEKVSFNIEKAEQKAKRGPINISKRKA